jgi:hypothetical protein
MRNLIEDELRNGSYNLIHIEPGYVWPSLPHTDLPIVLSEHNIEHEVYAGYVSRSLFRCPLWIDIAKLKRWEEKIWRQATRVIAVFDGDKGKISSVIDSGKISIVKNGVDLPSFPFKPKQKLLSHKITFLYVGNFAWIENRDAVFIFSKIYGRKFSGDIRKPFFA